MSLRGYLTEVYPRRVLQGKFRAKDISKTILGLFDSAHNWII